MWCPGAGCPGLSRLCWRQEGSTGGSASSSFLAWWGSTRAKPVRCVTRRGQPWQWQADPEGRRSMPNWAPFAAAARHKLALQHLGLPGSALRSTLTRRHPSPPRASTHADRQTPRLPNTLRNHRSPLRRFPLGILARRRCSLSHRRALLPRGATLARWVGVLARRGLSKAVAGRAGTRVRLRGRGPLSGSRVRDAAGDRQQRHVAVAS